MVEIVLIRPLVIIVQKAQVASPGIVGAEVHGVTLTMTIWPVQEPEEGHLLMLLFQPCILSHVCIVGAVDHYDDFLVCKCLLQHRVQRDQEQLRPVTGGNYDGEKSVLFL